MKKIFIIHGWTYNLDKWANVTVSLKSRGLEPVFLKVPGLTEPSDKVWDIDGYINWLDTQIGSEPKPIVIGHSNGGRIALCFAQKHPGRLGQLILIDSAGIAHNERRSVVKLNVLKVLSKVGKVFAYVPVVRKAFYRLIGAQDYLNAPPNMKLTMRNMLAVDQNIDLGAVKLPVTIIWGRDDEITPLTDGQKMQAAIAGSTLHIVDGARHAPFFTSPDEVAKIIATVVGNTP